MQAASHSFTAGGVIGIDLSAFELDFVTQDTQNAFPSVSNKVIRKLQPPNSQFLTNKVVSLDLHDPMSWLESTRADVYF